MTVGLGILSANLASLADGHPRVTQMLSLSVGRVIYKTEGDDVEKIIHAVEVNKYAIRHIADWFKSAILEDSPWLANVDEHGHPKKLMKFGSLERIVAEADKVMIRKSRGLGRRGLGEGAEEVIATLEGGYSIVRLLTPAALDAESHEMQHCIGHGSYDAYLEEGSTTMLLSLRDRNGRAHATAEIKDGKIVQVQGKQNKAPANKYLALFVRYFVGENFDFGDFGDGSEGWVADTHGVIHRCDRLPRLLRVPGDLRLYGGMASPLEIEARGHVNLGVDVGETPPRTIKARGGIRLIGKGFRELPEIETGGQLHLDHTEIAFLPDGLCVKGLHVEDTPLQRLPDDIKIEGSLCLRMTKVTSLPPSLWFRGGAAVRALGTVDVTGSPVSSLGGLNEVGGSLLLGSTAMKELPDKLFVAKHLDISTTAIRDIPGGVRVGGDMTVTNADVRFRHDEFIVGGSVNIRHSKVRMPKRLVCGRTFKVSDSVLVMPEHIQCGGDVSIENTKLDRFPRRIKAGHVWMDKVRPSGFLNRLGSLDCDLETNLLTVMDKQLKFGAEVKAETVVVFVDAKRAVSMTTEQAREYLGKHKAFARRGGLTAYAESISGTVRERVPRNGEVLFFTGPGAEHGRRIVYDEFHRSAA